jgi:hypothetical protein
MKQLEYTEGPEARENFERLARAILQAPKPKIKPIEAAAEGCYFAQAQEERQGLERGAAPQFQGSVVPVPVVSWRGRYFTS